nr:hypothetical protein [Budvicia aquatica]
MRFSYKGVVNKLRLPLTNQVNVKLSIVEVTKILLTTSVLIGAPSVRMQAPLTLLSLMLTP